MSRPRKAPIPGWVGWLGLACYVLAWDAHGQTQTMSTAFCPVGKRYGGKVYCAVWIYLTAHLTRVLPEGIDPLRQLSILKRKEAHR